MTKYTKELFYLFFAIFITFLLNTCANVIKPAGGPVDEKPPELVLTSPQNYSTRFDKRQIILEFDKFIELLNPIENIFISPPISPNPRYEARRRNLLISFNNDSLLENTTYTIYFGDAVRDLREANVATDLKFVFSTGDYLDSFIVQGTVTDAYTLEPKENMRVLLHKSLKDSAVFNKLPLYVGRTNAEGFFKIENVKYGTYRAYAIKDENRNFLYDNKEEFAFIDKPVYISDTLVQLELFSFVYNWSKPILLNHRVLKEGKVRFAFNRNIENFNIQVLGPSGQQHKKEWVFKSFNETNDTVIFWQMHPFYDSLSYLITFNDTINDTVIFDMTLSARNRITIKDSLLKYKTLINPMGRLGLGKNFEIFFDDPVVVIDKSKISIIKDSSLNLVNFEVIHLNKSFTKAGIEFPQESDMFYEVNILPGAFIDIYNNTNDTLYFPFRTQSQEAYGLLHFNVVVEKEIDAPLLFQLLDRNMKIVREKNISKNESVVFQHLEPQTYKARIIVDNDNNGKWTSGNFLKGQQPEKVYYYPDIITLRANWDISDMEFMIK